MGVFDVVFAGNDYFQLVIPHLHVLASSLLQGFFEYVRYPQPFSLSEFSMHFGFGIFRVFKIFLM